MLSVRVRECSSRCREFLVCDFVRVLVRNSLIGIKVLKLVKRFHGDQFGIPIGNVFTRKRPLSQRRRKVVWEYRMATWHHVKP